MTTWIVSNTNLSGPGSFFQAALSSNASVGVVDTIAFNMAADDPRHFYYRDDGEVGQISPSSTAVTAAEQDTDITDIDPDHPHSWWSILFSGTGFSDPVFIDGYSQAGASANTLAVGSDAVLRIELRGPGGFNDALLIGAGNSVVRGLVINGWREGIGLFDKGSNSIQGNYIGTDISGTHDLGNRVGISLGNPESAATSAFNRIGGNTAATRNVIAGNDQAGIWIRERSSDNTVQGNYIGTNAEGNSTLANAAGIVALRGRNTIGGTNAAVGNLVAGNLGNGIEFGALSSSNVVGANLIGTNSVGANLSNGGHGVVINAGFNVIGADSTSAIGNTIAFNGGDGVFVSAGTRNSIRFNSIHSNVGLGIDLSPNNVTVNDSGDVDLGANNGQNYPILVAATNLGTTTRVEGTLNSIANGFFTLQFFANPTADATGFGEGKVYLGQVPLTTNASGYATFTADLTTGVAVGHYVSATATDSLGNTSEFSQVKTVVAINEPPVAQNDSYTVLIGGTLTIDTPGVLANDSDVDGDSLMARLSEAPTTGQLDLHSDGSFIYTPVAGFAGTVTFQYLVNDGSSDSAAAAVTITVGERRRPVLFIPGIGGTYTANLETEMEWLLTRGIHPDKLAIEPLTGTYDRFIESLKVAGYVEGEYLFVANYDWRLPPAPDDGIIDGHISGLTASLNSAESGELIITDTQFTYGVDYLGFWLRQVTESWAKRFGETLDAVDVVTHSTGGLVARSYIQSDAYGQTFETPDLPGGFSALPLPKVNEFIMVGVPNRGATLPWNPLHNNFNGDTTLRLVVASMVLRAYQEVTDKGGAIEGPERIDRNSILDATGEPSMTLFIHQYLPTLRSLLATFDFLRVDGPDSPLTNVNHLPSERNTVLLDLNNGLDLTRPLGDFRANDFANLTHVSALFGASNETPSESVQYAGPLDRWALEGPIVSFDSFFAHDPLAGEIWYEDVKRPANGDDTVPLDSTRGQFVGDARVDLYEFRQDDGSGNGNTDAAIGHGKLFFNTQVQSKILEILGHPLPDNEIVEGGDDLDIEALLTGIGFPKTPIERLILPYFLDPLPLIDSTVQLVQAGSDLFVGLRDGRIKILDGRLNGSAAGSLQLDLDGTDDDGIFWALQIQLDAGVTVLDMDAFTLEGQFSALVNTTSVARRIDLPDVADADDPLVLNQAYSLHLAA